jgi:HK97 family phage portal protein
MLESLFERRNTFHVSQSPPGWVVKGYGNETHTGDYVSPESALSTTAVLAAFTILSEDSSSLPLITYRRLKRGKERATDSSYYSLFHDAFNDEHTSMIFREVMMGHLLGWGNFYGQLIWDKKGRVVEIWPLRPDRMQVARKNGRKVYLYTKADGSPRAFTQDQIWHVPAFGFDGLQGYSRITLARNAIGLAVATEKFGSKFFANDARPSLALKLPAGMKDPARGNVIESWQKAYGGANNSWKVALLEEGLDIKEIGIPPEDAQFLETRKFQVTEIGRIFRVPPHMIGDMERSTSWGSGIEQQEIGYVSHTLRPWLTRIQQTISQQVFLSEERKELVVEHLVEDFLRGDSQARYSMYVQAINNGIMSPNEVREKENMNPYKGGDDYLRPLNMTSAGKEQKPQDGSRNALKGIYQDAIQRVVKRELNDLVGAARRYLAKNQPEKFGEWLDTFYQEHGGFMKRQLQPILDAENDLFEEAYYLNFDEFIDEYCQKRYYDAQKWLETNDFGKIEQEIGQSQPILQDELYRSLFEAATETL